jgi:hypothetical protein
VKDEKEGRKCRKTHRRQSKMSSSKNFTLKGLGGRCFSFWGPETHTPLLTQCILYVYAVYSFTQGRGRGRVEP